MPRPPSSRRVCWRSLAKDKDVVAISTDAEVTSDGVAAVTGEALNSAYSLRSTLGFRPLAVPSRRRSSRVIQRIQWHERWRLQEQRPDTNYQTASSIKVEVSGLDSRGMLVRFNNLFGTGTGQIPAGSTIVSAALRVTTVSDGSTSGTTSLYRMLANWIE